MNFMLYCFGKIVSSIFGIESDAQSLRLSLQLSVPMLAKSLVNSLIVVCHRLASSRAKAVSLHLSSKSFFSDMSYFSRHDSTSILVFYFKILI